MKYLILLSVFFIPAAIADDIVWCNSQGECIKQLDKHKLVNVPWHWKTPNITYTIDGAKNVKKETPDECTDCLVVGPGVISPADD